MASRWRILFKAFASARCLCSLTAGAASGLSAHASPPAGRRSRQPIKAGRIGDTMKKIDYPLILSALARLITAIAVLVAALRRG